MSPEDGMSREVVSIGTICLGETKCLYRDLGFRPQLEPK